ncbi:polysaccharide biosynthesis C-terminal domain-containing protein, partial [bacterium]|nr:polysaccharide biosynthesis C-terminal domain-containing protein [bacterium]
LVVCATAASVLFLPRLIEPVFGSGFAEASLPCAILCVSVGMTAYNYNLEQAFRALADQGPVIAAELLGAVVSAVLVVVLFAHFGIVGAAIGTVTGSISTSGTLIGLWVQRFNRPIAELVIPRRAELLLWAGRLRRSWRE